MSSNVQILVTGYADLMCNKIMKATGTCCLVQTNGINILFDTMGPWQRDLLIGKLNSFKIHPNDINLVVCSHGHFDHVGNLNLFTNCNHLVGTSVYKSDEIDMNHFEARDKCIFKLKSGEQVERVVYDIYKIESTNCYVEPTPGHMNNEDVSLIVKNCDKYGTVGLVGDLFEREEDLENENIWLAAGSNDPKTQRLYREYIYKKVDYIVPGHGPLFKTKNT